MMLRSFRDPGKPVVQSTMPKNEAATVTAGASMHEQQRRGACQDACRLIDTAGGGISRAGTHFDGQSVIAAGGHGLDG
ncbi:hypothetical protein D8B34_09580 [Verminephrobacter eiseniae]|nr:hypothetical protein [Verminephrobacter eiseniae]MCW5293830.1 hypothetical protein [Verminephrobacter eiseniae]MCW8183837.1 hypothetical protein [Verminephrobacter eiseniae]MCW8222415.1 hypothetical protein [Verminephrobacter eiseniae]MCW8234011.1 hypothetical protein [Verminephrobacter eiseniae]